ncbi:mitochondrial 37S ribosomal protein bS21m MRP21 [Rhodotorula paludigena]|uniref:mitochondrial 37S ribosomal protein bS21m MRP21 n=1 Tax=Rhodotorula paludigena TaxID=86838 RepID=UPI0031738168
MNSLVSSFRSQLRLGACSTPRALVAAHARPYSTPPAPASAEPSSSATPSASTSSSPSTSSPSAPPAGPLDDVIKSIRSRAQSSPRGGKPSGAPKSTTPSALDAFAGRGAAHDALARTYFGATTSSARSAQRVAAASPEDTWRFAPPVPYSQPASTTSARSFAVRDGNVARAYRTLNRVLFENNVRRELRRQERFESPSNRRVRLNSERHRRRFKVAVGKAVSLAMRMKDM